jgi:hypothetical protein
MRVPASPHPIDRSVTRDNTRQRTLVHFRNHETSSIATTFPSTDWTITLAVTAVIRAAKRRTLGRTTDRLPTLIDGGYVPPPSHTQTPALYMYTMPSVQLSAPPSPQKSSGSCHCGAVGGGDMAGARRWGRRHLLRTHNRPGLWDGRRDGRCHNRALLNHLSMLHFT